MNRYLITWEDDYTPQYDIYEAATAAEAVALFRSGWRFVAPMVHHVGLLIKIPEELWG